MKKIRLITFLLFYCFLGLSAQDSNECFNAYMQQGKDALKEKKPNFEIAIKSFQGALQLCDNLTRGQKDEATDSLKIAFDKNKKILKEETYKSEARRLAFLADLEKTDNLLKLELAYYAKDLINGQVPIFAVERAFGNAIRDSFSILHENIELAYFLNNSEIAYSPNKNKHDTLNVHQGSRLSIIPYGQNKYITTSKDKTAKIWDSNNKFITTLKGHEAAVNIAVVEPDTSFIITGSTDGTIIFWDTTGNKIKDFRDQHTASIYQIEFSSDGQFMFTRSADKTVGLWRISDKSFIKSLKHDGVIPAAAFIKEGKEIITVSADKKIKIWNTEDGALLKILSDHTAPIHALDISKDYKQFLTFDAARTTIIWKEEGSLEKKLPSEEHLVNVQFSYNPNEMLYRYETAFKLISNTDTTIFKHDGYINGVVFSSDGQYILSWSQDKTARLWNLEGNELLQLNQFNKSVEMGQFAPDSSHIMAYDTSLVICPIPKYQYELLQNEKFKIRDSIITEYDIIIETVPIADKTKKQSSKLPPEEESTFTNNHSTNGNTNVPSELNISDKKSVDQAPNKKETDKVMVAKQEEQSDNKKTTEELNNATGDSSKPTQVAITDTTNALENEDKIVAPKKLIHSVITKTSLRIAPNSKAKVLKRLQQTEQVVLLNEATKYWFKVLYGEREGWVKKHCLKLSEP